MKKLFVVAIILVAAAMLLWLAGCGKEDNTATSPIASRDVNRSAGVMEQPIANAPGGQSGTTLSDVVTASCFNYFDWSCVKMMDAGPFRLCKNECQELTATVSVTKGAQHIGYSGTICVTNGGGVATTDLKVGATLMYHAKGGFDPSTCTVSGLESQHPILAAGESFCYTYTINASAGCLISDNNSYRVDGIVTIMNHSGHLGVPWGPEGKSDSYLLCPPSNDCVNVSDVPGTPINSLDQSDATSWTITVTSQNPVNVCQSGDIPFTLQVCNVNAPNEETWTVTNTATVDNHTCEANFGLSSVGCTPPNLGCSYTQGFWKTHGCVGPKGKSQYGNNPNLITPLLESGNITMGARVITTCEEAGAAFQGAQGNEGNAIKRLYSQMLAALLNIRNGADGSCIAQAIADANAVLSAADPNGDASGWTNVTGEQRSAIQSAASTFDKYNNGLMCVPHCD